MQVDFDQSLPRKERHSRSSVRSVRSRTLRMAIRDYFNDILLFLYIAISTVLVVFLREQPVIFIIQALAFLLYYLRGNGIVLLAGWALWITVPISDAFSVYALVDYYAGFAITIIRDLSFLIIATIVVTVGTDSKALRVGVYALSVMTIIFSRNLIGSYRFLELLRVALFCFNFKMLESFANWYHLARPIEVTWFATGWILFSNYFTWIGIVWIVGICSYKYRRKKKLENARVHVDIESRQPTAVAEEFHLPEINLNFTNGNATRESSHSSHTSQSSDSLEFNKSPTKKKPKVSSKITMVIENNVLYAPSASNVINSDEFQRRAAEYINSNRERIIIGSAENSTR